MCGIVGFLKHGQASEADEHSVLAMAACLTHRGPDDGGIYREANVILGHRRLSIIDLSSAGHQPMTTKDGRFTLVFNGEIYNYRELAEQYCQGVSFASKTDTEVLLYLLAQKGEAALPWLRGMFALALWDRHTQTLLLARDPWGKKPLYYVATIQGFVFASEVKALLVHPAVTSELDPVALTKYLLHEYVPAPATGYCGITQLPGGQVARLKNDSFSTATWWRPAFVPKHVDDETKLVTQFDALLAQAVERRLIADVPVGLFLSGGLDSTTIGWYMRQAGRQTIHSFSVGFAAATYDESAWARTAATALNADHHAITFDEQDFIRYAPRAAASLDIPFGDSSLLPTMAVSDAAAARVKVVLDGDGSDELLGGYGTFAAEEVAAWLPHQLRSWWHFLGSVSHYMPTSHRYFSLDFKIKSFLRGLPYGTARRQQIWLGSFSDHELRRLLQPAYQAYINDVFSSVDAAYKNLRPLSRTDVVSGLYLEQYLHDDILVKLDRATMQASLEARTPFLDIDLAEFLLRLPSKYKRNKHLLKRLMRGRLPASIIDRPKQGFAMPLGQWLKGSLFAWANEVLGAPRLHRHGLFNEAYVHELLQEHRAGKADHRKKLWTLLSFQMWHDQWVG